MKVRIFKPATYAGPKAFDPQVTTTEPDEVIDVEPNMAAHFVTRKHGSIVEGEAEPAAEEASADETETDEDADTGAKGKGRGRRGKG